MATLADIRLHRDDMEHCRSFYWNVRNGRRVGEAQVRRLAGQEFFFDPEQQRPAKMDCPVCFNSSGVKAYVGRVGKGQEREDCGGTGV